MDTREFTLRIVLGREDGQRNNKYTRAARCLGERESIGRKTGSTRFHVESANIRTVRQRVHFRVARNARIPGVPSDLVRKRKTKLLQRIGCDRTTMAKPVASAGHSELKGDDV